MIGYLSSINASKSVDVLREELHLQDRFPEEAVENYAKVPVLARKWTSVARLHRKVKLSYLRPYWYTDWPSSDQRAGVTKR